MRLRSRSNLIKTSRGFTLVEVAVAIVVVGVGATALLQLTAACTQQNRAAAEMTTAAMLAQHVQEILADLPISDPAVGSTNFGREPEEMLETYDDVDDFDGLTLEPVDSTRTAISGLNDYQQRVTVVPISGKKLNGNLAGTDIAKSTYTGAVRIRVEILRSDPFTGTAGVIHQLEWVRVED